MSTVEHVLPVEAHHAFPWPTRYRADSVLAFLAFDFFPVPPLYVFTIYRLLRLDTDIDIHLVPRSREEGGA